MRKLNKLEPTELTAGNVLDLSNEVEQRTVERLHNNGIFNNYGLLLVSDPLMMEQIYHPTVVWFPSGKLEVYRMTYVPAIGKLEPTSDLSKIAEIREQIRLLKPAW